MTAPSEPAAAFRLPTDPYPGLRPFLDHESALLLGRGRQVREIIDHLRETHFVAVIGGSGSGKSSLIRAGVVPELRGFGIPDAGDYWVSVVFTPGTAVAGAHAAAAQTPITRLAWKLSQALDPAAAVLRRRIASGEIAAPAGAVDDEIEAARRRDDIAAGFRQGPGFARLIDAFSAELPALGPDRENARFLFVIDQFEEVFHPNNRGSEDAKALVEAVIDHFFDPHPRCFVVLTMRSEYLAACAGFLELPDAINKSSYLVRRLDDAELREAIVGPAKYFLRLLQRGRNGTGARLPEDVVFDEAVIARLLSDVGKIKGDADHLPLLQHVLARTWQAAVERTAAAGSDSPVPARIEWGDLERAVGPQLDPGWLRGQEAINTLRSSLENWAESIYRARAPHDRDRIDIVLRHLAYKDPNSGQYTQQRVDVDDATLFEGVSEPRDVLRELLERGFLDTVNYLFWDKENPQQVTLKVSHESFIRGWEHFRQLIDGEAERFEEFVALLRKCLAWGVERDDDVRRRLLLEVSDFERLERAQLTPLLSPGIERQRWFGVLPEHRDGDRLASAEAQLDEFVAASRARLQHREAERARARIVRRSLYGGGVFLVLTLICAAVATAFAILYQGPAMLRIEQYAQARDLAARNGDRGQYSTIEEAVRYLKGLVTAAGTFDSDTAESMTTVGSYVEDITDALREHGAPLIGSKRLLHLTTSEPPVNGTLRRMLTSVAWPVAATPQPIDPSAPRRLDPSCTVTTRDGRTEKPPGLLFVREEISRGILVAQNAGSDGSETALYDVTLDRNGRCVSGQFAWAPPTGLKVQILFDERAEYMAMASTAQGAASVSLYSISWVPSQDQTALVALVKFRSVVTDPAIAALVDREIKRPGVPGDANAVGVKTWRQLGGIGASVGGLTWRLFSESAQRLEASSDAAWLPLAPAGEICRSLGNVLRPKVQAGFRLEMFEHGNHCFEIQQGNPPTMQKGEALATEQVLLAVYRRPVEVLDGGDEPPPSLASIANFGRFAAAAGTDAQGKWFVSDAGRLQGWIARRQPMPGGETAYYAAPWSTLALKRLAETVVPPGAASAPAHSPK